MTENTSAAAAETDIVLIGAGIMSATLGTLLKELQPGLRITVLERLDSAAAESSDAWNNAGTGHSAFCELNYTPERADGSIEISRAIKIAESFEVSKQFWAHLISNNRIASARSFVVPIPHMSFVWGEKNVHFLKKRHQALTACHLFRGMEFSADPEQVHRWIPLVMEGRDLTEPVAATRMALGTDVNFGALTRGMFHWLRQQRGVAVSFNSQVRNLKQLPDGRWRIRVKDRTTGAKHYAYARFVFIGAGGGALRLLEKSDIPEASGYGGFPVSGQWLVCKKPELVARHYAKVYGTAGIGAPPMSVPHLDTRLIGADRALFFGPFAGFSTKFLKHGSYLDLAASIQLDNILPMLSAGIRNLPLTKYLLDQVRLTPDQRLETLREYFPNAELADWELEVAGQRVQVIKDDPEKGGVLEFGTEVISAADGSLAALLGASPGASTAVSIMLDVLQRCFPAQLASPDWQQKLQVMIPSYGQKLGDNAALAEKVRTWTTQVLGLEDAASAVTK